MPSFQVAAPELASLLNDEAERYALPPISRVGLREAIVAPARLAGVEYEPAMLERLMLDAEVLANIDPTNSDGQVLTHASTLPLVAHVLHELWESGLRADKLVRLADYLAIGGVGGALDRSADRLVRELDESEQKRAKVLLLALVRVSAVEGETRRTLTRDEAVALAGEDVILKLSGGATANHEPCARLLVVVCRGEQTWVDLIHEALLHSWGTLVRWIEEDRGQLVLDGELERQANHWDKHGRPRWNLARGREYARLLQGRPRGAGESTQRAYQASLRRAARVRRSAWSFVAAIVTTVAVTVALVLLAKNDEIRRQHEEVEDMMFAQPGDPRARKEPHGGRAG